MQRLAIAGLALAALAASGCDALSFLLTNTVNVRFVNDGEFAVDAVVFIHDEQDTPEFLLTEVGEEINLSIPAGDVRSLVRTCEELQVILVDDADLRIIGGIGPEAKSDVLRDGDDFNCGSTITFTFDHSDLIVDFDVTSSVQQR
ncbi:MAG: hypothetical protein C4547_11095 [Phycisphaerales bacterium]|nr:MAG: hypothetical protein C4547_11095 [Phycisphaerales bacterium]